MGTAYEPCIWHFATLPRGAHLNIPLTKPDSCVSGKMQQYSNSANALQHRYRFLYNLLNA